MKYPFLIRRVLSKNGSFSEPLGFWIESTAPLEVDFPGLEKASDALFEQSPFRLTDDEENGVRVDTDAAVDAAIEAIAERLASEEKSELLIAVHGYNNPVDTALKFMMNLYSGLDGDQAIRKRKELVCVGYHWPSEKLGDPLRDKRFDTIDESVLLRRFHRWRWRLLRGAPSFLKMLGGVGLALIALGAGLAYWGYGLHGWLDYLKLLGATGAGLLGFVFTALLVVLPLLRLSAYFRDQYRAIQYGVPDMVRFFQLLDARLAEQLKEQPERRIAVSFIGHSMGAYVVTSLVRVLSDVFDSASVKNESRERSNNHFGRCLRFGRLVLASPDIPAEALKTVRSNFLASSLRRFDEAYLFSNAGDEVLRAISSVANYFSFPAGSVRFGYRLGNVDLRFVSKQGKNESVSFGFFELDKKSFEENVIVGEESLGHFIEKQGGTTELARKFTYIDCTDFKENDVAYLSEARCKIQLNGWDHLRLLFKYARRKVDFHSGYFESHTVRRLLLRLAALGWDVTLAAEEPGLASTAERETAFHTRCQNLQLQVLRERPPS